MPRTLPDDVRTGLQGSTCAGALLAFVQIDHEDLSNPIRVVCDPVDYIWQGETWVGVVFEWTALTETDAVPTATLRVPNVDRRIGRALERLSGRASVQLWVLSSDDFDLTLKPREATGAPGVIYSFTEYTMTQVRCDAGGVSGTLKLRDYSQEPWPGRRATQASCPGLYR